MKKMTVDGNGAVAYISYAFSELAIIYPITPSSPMSELADEWQSYGKENLFGIVPQVVEMQSEAGAAGALHGAATCGALTVTYTCSQGLLLMLPNMYKLAGELLPTVFHVSARALATHALSIFGDHQDVMACRQTGFALLCSASVQEAHDLAIVAHLATLKTSVPFLHFFDGFRTSHEASKIDVLEYDELSQLIPLEELEAFRERALSPNAPTQRGTAQNPDVYFQNRERANLLYQAVPNRVQAVMELVGKATGRRYRLFDYHGAPDAERVLIIMGSGAETAEETVDSMNEKGEKVGLIKVRLYRPFDGERLCDALPPTCKTVAVLDRTKEAGSVGEPLYLDVCAALTENGRSNIRVFGGRYGLGSKEFTPSMVYATFENLRSLTPKNRFTVGIDDDVSLCSLPKNDFTLTTGNYTACKFYGLGSDGTVGANKNSIKIIGDNTNLFVQGYFQYDSRKSGGYTVSHLRFGKTPIRAAYLVQHPDFVACHTPSYLTRYEILNGIHENGTFLLNCPWGDLDSLNAHLPPSIKQTIAQKRLSFYVIDATKISHEEGLQGKHSTVMQAAFFLLQPQLLPYEKALSLLKDELTKKFQKKGDGVVSANVRAVDRTKESLLKIDYPKEWTTATDGKDVQNDDGNEYYRSFIAPILSLRGDELPVSSFSPDGTVPTDTAKLEKHGVARLAPQWIKENCIQCNRCSFVCPHACIRPFLVEEEASLPEEFETISAVGFKGYRFRIQLSVHDCMGCELCARICPAKEKALVMAPVEELRTREGKNWKIATKLPPPPEALYKKSTVKGSQFSRPLFEFSYACAGCGETAYIKLLTQLFGKRLLIANATGCSSIYGGSAPTCPYAKADDGKGPAWANSLFEDNAEFGLGMRLAQEVSGKDLPSVWCIGGDGWAYDIGYGGLDHVLASNKNVNILVLDSEVYSNTGGQASKATPTGAIARFATLGKRMAKKPLAMMAMAYQNAYVAQVCLGADMQQLIKALTEAEAHDGPSLVIAYTPCIAHGVDMRKSVEEEALAVECGYWHLFRYNPISPDKEHGTFFLDSKTPTRPLQDFLLGENRFAALKKSNPELFDELTKRLEKQNERLYSIYKKLSEGAL